MKVIKVWGFAAMLAASGWASAVDFERLQWQTSVREDNLKVDLAPVAGQSVKAFRATSVYKATIPQMVGLLTDMERFTEWAEGAAESRVIKQLDATSQATYYVNAVPWPLKNRDGVIVQQVKRIDPQTVHIELSTLKDFVPEDSKYVRITELHGRWVLRQLDEGSVEATYFMHLDPTGNLPTSVVNMMLADTPTKTLKNIHKRDLSGYNGSPLLEAASR